MDLSSEKIKRILSKYKFHDVAIEELQKINRIFPEMKTSPDTYTFSDSSQRDLLKLIGNIPVKYEGHTYNFPIQLWLLDSFPFTPPICLLRPTSNMIIREGKHVDAKGRIHLPGLHNWDYPKSSVVLLIKEMITKFEADPPLSSRSNKDPHELLAMVSNLQINDGGVRNHNQQNIKVSVIGGGDLGMASVLSIVAKCNVDKLVFVDVTESSTKGGSTDLEIFSVPNVEVSKDLLSSAGSRVLVVTANAWSSEQSYVKVVQTNVDMYRGIIPNLARLSPNAVIVVASQPVEIMTHVAWKQSGFPPTRVIGAGCNLDSERLSRVLDINLNTHKQAWVIGELSDNKVPVMSNTSLNSSIRPEIAPASSATKPLLDRMEETGSKSEVENVISMEKLGFEMMKNKGQRSWSVGLSIADITNSILTDQMKAHSVSTLAQGWGGISSEVFLSLPCVLGANGSTRLAGVTLGEEDDSKLRDSVSSLTNLMGQIQL